MARGRRKPATTFESAAIEKCSWKANDEYVDE